MIKIEVTGNSIPEVADKLIAIGRSLYNTSVNDADNAAREAMQAQRTAAKTEVAEVAPAPLPPSDGPTEASPNTEPKASASSPTEASDAQSETTPPASASELNFDTDVAPYVLQVVKEKGKPVAQEILSQFGVEKASSLDPARWPELVDTLKAAL